MTIEQFNLQTRPDDFFGNAGEGCIDPDLVLVDLLALGNHKIPNNKTEVRILKALLKKSAPDNPLQIFVGSCPDYSHQNGLYDHRSVGGGIPLLTRYHLENDINLLRILDKYGVQYIYKLMVADVEACDDVFCMRFTAGSKEEFKRRCNSSVRATKNEMDKLANTLGLSGILVSSSFFMEFGEEKFLLLQQAYQRLLEEEYENDDSFRARVTEDIILRMEMYRKMYADVLDRLSGKEREDFLAKRTIRTMAQYLTLGKLISEKADNSIIINHPTRNIGMFNKGNKYSLVQSKIPQRTIPVFEMNRRVY